jgi:hypothetical protein
VVDKATKMVHCSLCDGTMPQIGPFMANQILSNKRIRNQVVVKKQYTFPCPVCKANDQPVLSKDGNLHCHILTCNAEMTNISVFHKPLIVEFLKRKAQE